MNLLQIRKHLFYREYMSGIARDKLRVNSTGEVFTPTERVEIILDNIEKNDTDAFTKVDNTFIDRSAGDGKFLASVLYRKLQNGIDFETALSTIYGVDLMQDNVELCRERLLCGFEEYRHIVEQNIVQAYGLRYHYRFQGPGENPYDDEADEQHFGTIFD